MNSLSAGVSIVSVLVLPYARLENLFLPGRLFLSSMAHISASGTPATLPANGYWAIIKQIIHNCIIVILS